MLADGSAPSVLAPAPLAVVLALRKGAEAASGGSGAGWVERGFRCEPGGRGRRSTGHSRLRWASADGLAARGAGKGAVEQRGARA
jgi:hypothetical protein